MKGVTPEFQLVRQFDSVNASRFERGTASRFSIETEDVGKVTIVHLRQAASTVVFIGMHKLKETHDFRCCRPSMVLGVCDC